MALSQEFAEERNVARKKGAGSNFLMPINDCASKEARDRAIDPRVPGMPVEKLGRNSASRNPEEGREGKKKSSRIPARQNSHVIPRVEFDDGMTVSMPSRRPSWNCYIRDWQLSTGATDQCSIHRWIVTDSRRYTCPPPDQSARLPIAIVHTTLSISYNTRIIMHAKCTPAM